MLRRSAVAGYFYPSNPEHLRQFIQANSLEKEKLPAYGAIVPHAGYIYSGETAAKVYSTCSIPPRVVLMGPNHTGYGPPASIYPKGQWETPLGEVSVDDALVEHLVSQVSLLKADTSAHWQEHALEVQLPFLQYHRRDVKILPIVLALHQKEEILGLAQAISQVLQPYKDEIMVIASSDMNHYEDEDTTLKKDQQALLAIQSMDPAKLYEVIHAYKISMCGYVPAMVAMGISQAFGAKEAKIIAHTTSAQASGDTSKVVGYAGVLFL